MKLKKIVLFPLVLSLTLGASLTLGLLSFAGMYAIAPILILALLVFVLAVAYDSEIFSRNIHHALDKISKTDYLKRRLTNSFLLEHFPDETELNDAPAFFKDYALLLKQHHQAKNRRQKKVIHKKLKALDKQLAAALFRAPDEAAHSAFESDAVAWLSQKADLEALNSLFLKRRRQFRVILALSALTSISMAIGTAVLISESIMVIPAVALLLTTPWAIPLLALLGLGVIAAGIAYALMTYNAMTDILLNDVLGKWFKKLIAVYDEGIGLESVLVSTTALLLIALALVLTICTAGTWWTIGQHAIPLLPAFGRIPGIIFMRFINPLVLGFCALVYNIPNTWDSFLFLLGWTNLKKGAFNLFESLGKAWAKIKENEHPLQIINPARILLIATITPLRWLLFLGHLISMAVTGDRMPGIPEIVTAMIGFICEFFEDLHYFFGEQDAHDKDEKNPCIQKLLEVRHSEHADHDHANDIPTRILKVIFSPLYLLSISWDWLFSQLRDEPLSFAEACKKQHLFIYDYEETLIDLGLLPDAPVAEFSEQISTAGNNAIAAYKIKRFQEKHFGGLTLFGRDNAKEKSIVLSDLGQNLESASDPRALLEEKRAAESIDRHRSIGRGQTATAAFMDKLMAEHYPTPSA